MKRWTLIAAVTGIACAAASSAFAQSGIPGSTPSKPNKVTAVPPPPPPPGGPDKFTTRTQPPGDAGLPRPSREPKPFDDFAARPKDPAKSLDVTCSQSWCMEIVIAWCDKKGGSLSTNPDGSITCSVSKGPHVIGSLRGPVQPPKPPRPGVGNVAATPKAPQKSGLEITCSSEWCMKSIVAGCDKNGGGLSSNPDGSVTCSL
jgi:hypothetical protein